MSYSRSPPRPSTSNVFTRNCSHLFPNRPWPSLLFFLKFLRYCPVIKNERLLHHGLGLRVPGSISAFSIFLLFICFRLSRSKVRLCRLCARCQVMGGSPSPFALFFFSFFNFLEEPNVYPSVPFCSPPILMSGLHPIYVLPPYLYRLCNVCFL